VSDFDTASDALSRSARSHRAPVVILLFATGLIMGGAVLSRLAPDNQVVIRSLSPNATTTITYGYGDFRRTETVHGSWPMRLKGVNPGDRVFIEIVATSRNADVMCEIFFDGTVVASQRSHDPPSVACTAIHP
jgi:hypothetical protein